MTAPSLAGRVAVVSGGATSIGAAVATAFHAAGASVVIADRLAGEGRALAASLGERALFQCTDVTDDDAIAACIGTASERFGGVDMLACLACSYLDQGIGSSRADWHRALDVNLMGAAVFLRETAPAMRRRGGGAVVLMGSVAGRFGQRGRALYPVAKAALAQLARSAAMELAADGIRVNAVVPGWTWSAPLEKAAAGDRARADRAAAALHPLGRAADAGEVAAAVLFLCSDQAAFVTGTEFTVDGGYSITGPDGGTPAMARLSR